MRIEKKFAVLMLTGLVVLGASASSFAQSHGSGHGGGQSGQSGTMKHGGMAALSPEKQKVVNEILSEAQAKAFPLRQDIFSKRAELDAVMAQATPDLAKAKAVNKEIGALETQIEEIQIEAHARIVKETGVRSGMGMSGGGCSMMGGGGCPMMGSGAGGMGASGGGCSMMGGHMQ